MNRQRTAAVLFVAGLVCASHADNPMVRADPTGDVLLRRTDLGAVGAVNAAGVLPDLISLSHGRWRPTNAAANPYAGTYSEDPAAHFMRIDVTLAGCVNPPGTLALDGGFYDPYLFGPSPVFGFIEFDVDENPDTGGELGGAAVHRYPAIAARMGALPTINDDDDDTFPMDRYVVHGSQIDFTFGSPPQYERSGADFSMSFCGCAPPTVVSQGGDGDGLFEPGETWIVRGRFFERFAGFQSASGFWGGSDFGLWDPLVDIRFSHSVASDTTTITLVFPLTQTGAGLLAGVAAQPIDFNVANQTSLAEAINDLAIQSSSISGAVRTLSLGWKNAVASDWFEVRKWRATAALATAYVEEQEALYAWTDMIYVTPGDFDGDGLLKTEDRTARDTYVYSTDGGSADADGSANGAVAIPSFGRSFSIYDTNYDGVVNAYDWPPGAADVNADTMVDILDLLDFLDVFAACEGLPGPCLNNDTNADFNLDAFVDILDFLDFVGAFAE